MDIKSINNQFPYSKNIKNNNVEKKNNNSTKDKLEISDTARILSDSVKDDKKIEEITKKIESKFYDSDEVIEKVADKILKDIKSK